MTVRAAKRLQTIHVKDQQGRIVSSWQRVRVPVPDWISASLPPPYTGLKHLTKKVQTEAEYAETKARFLAMIAGAGEWATIHRELGDFDRLSFDEITRRGLAPYRVIARLEQKQDEIFWRTRLEEAAAGRASLFRCDEPEMGETQ